MPGIDFWDFSLDFYGRKHVAPVCISLQDEYAVDVNRILFILWLALDRRVLDADHCAILEAGVGPWNAHVVSALRRVRRRVKAALDAPMNESTGELLKMLKATELESERVEQLQLAALRQTHFDALTVAASRRAAALASFAAYEMSLHKELPPADLHTLIGALEEVA